MRQQTAGRVWLLAAQALLGSAGVAVLTYVCYRLGLDVATTSLLNLIVIVLLSVIGSFGSAAVVAISATLSLDYFLVTPAQGFWWDTPFDIVAVAAFLITALVISRLLSKVRQSLREAEAARDQLRLAVDTIPALVWTTRPDGSSEFSNQRWLEYAGLSREQAEDWGYRSAIHPDDYKRLLPKWTASFAAGEAIEDEARMQRADGEYRWFLHRAVPLRDEQGSVVNWYGTSTDIEDRKRAEEVLRKQTRLLDLTHDTVLVRDMHDVITYWNRGAEALYGWASEEAVGKVTHQLLQTGFPAPLEEITAILHRTGRWEGELVQAKRDGSRVTVASRWALQRDERGNPVGTLETNNDITERKQVEDALRRSEAYLAEAQQLSHTASFGWNVVTGELFWSDEAYRIFQYEPANTTPSVDAALRRVHPEDLPRVQELVDRAARDGQDWEIDYRLLMPDGSTKYVHAVARATRDELGRLEFLGALMDVTGARQAEAELRRSETYLAEAQRLSHTGSWAVNLRDPKDRYWSAETYRIYGLEPANEPPALMVGQAGPLIGQAVPPYIHVDDRPKVQQAVAVAIRDKTDFEVHYRTVRPDGSIRYLFAIGHPVVNAAGEVVKLVGTMMDLTERRRAERALRRARERALKLRFDAVLDERTRLAREIHDTLLQGFTGVGLQLVAVTNRLTGSPEIAAALRDVVSQAQRTLGDARRAVWDLRTPLPAGGDFPTALRILAEDCVRGTTLALEYSVEGPPRPLSSDVEATATRVVQEAITNVVKHAAASTVRLRLSFEPRGVRLSIADDGRGFAVDQGFQAYGGHWGLLGMRERATQIQGKVRVRSAAGQGTEVVLLVPYLTRPRELTPSAAIP